MDKVHPIERFLRLSVFPWCKDRPLIVMSWWELLGRLKGRATGFNAFVSFISTSRKCSRKRSPNLLPPSPMQIFLHGVHVMQ